MAKNYPRILISGTSGQVGSAMLKKFSEYSPMECVSDFTNESDLRIEIQDKKPNIFINPAAYTAVDKAESEQELAFQVNSNAVRTIAEECKKLDSTLIHFSTDYVFDGTGKEFRREDEAVAPQNIYGKSKLAGEQFIQEILKKFLILRTSWVFSETGHNFVKTMLRLASERPELRIVDDQIGSPTSAHFLADACYQIVQSGIPHFGLFHLTNSGITSWSSFAQDIFAAAGKNVKIIPISTAEFPQPAKRPLNSRLDCSKIETLYKIIRPHYTEELSFVLTTPNSHTT